MLKRYEEEYEGFGPTYAVEKLAEEGFVLDHETLRRWLLRADLWKKSRRRRRHRTRRERKAYFGEMVQLDGSHHNWFGTGRKRRCLMNMVDDATSTKLSLMAQEETTEAAMRTLWLWIEPRVSRGSQGPLYRQEERLRDGPRRGVAIEEQLADLEPMTAFGKACKKLGIEIITANSPQAKGRVERSHGVYHAGRVIREGAQAQGINDYRAGERAAQRWLRREAQRQVRQGTQRPKGLSPTGAQGSRSQRSLLIRADARPAKAGLDDQISKPHVAGFERQPAASQTPSKGGGENASRRADPVGSQRQEAQVRTDHILEKAGGRGHKAQGR